MARKLYIDCDVLVYESAFAAQKTIYSYQGRDFENHKAWLAWAEENNVDAKYVRAAGQLMSRIEYMDESVARTILRAKISRILNECDTTDHALYLTGKGNYREDIAKTKVYKGNRDDVPKPLHYAYIRKQCVDMGAVVWDGIEADDALGIALTKNPNGVICTIDKDLNMVPGLHYDWNKGLKYRVDEVNAQRWFLRQLLTGDSTDNIPGIPKWGEVRANKLLDPLRDSVPKMWDAVFKEYMLGAFALPGGGDTGYPPDYLNEQGALLWIQRHKDERWSIDHYRSKYVN